MRKGLLLFAVGLVLAAGLEADPAVTPPASAPSAAAPVVAATPASSTATVSKDANVVVFPRGPDSQTIGQHDQGMSGSMMTLLVLLIGASAGWLLWRKLRMTKDMGRGTQLSISETKSLGNRQFLVVAAYGDRKFLLGVCPGRIDLLSPLDGTNPPASK